MSCPKCGSESRFHNTSYGGKDYCMCCDCKTYYTLPTVAVDKPELTLAEKLLYLAKNTNISIEKTCMLVDNQTYSWDDIVIDLLEAGNEKPIRTSSLAEAISKAYDWVIKGIENGNK